LNYYFNMLFLWVIKYWHSICFTGSCNSSGLFDVLAGGEVKSSNGGRQYE